MTNYSLGVFRMSTGAFYGRGAPTLTGMATRIGLGIHCSCTHSFLLVLPAVGRKVCRRAIVAMTTRWLLGCAKAGMPVSTVGV